ncbi:uncharacterized protein [Epargyreus clarus]|uniref:uncharacterized protein n=1 Tax=Epargyreus clarus TaxID=520877 RepID=UPI003C2C02F2
MGEDLIMDMEDINFSMTDLERRTYRYLQQLAKSLGLPSNVKKVYLIYLIHAKKYKSEKEVNSIIHHVKMERQQAQSRKRHLKKHLQNREISSTNKLCQSPPISNTPKRPVHGVVRYSPDLHHTYVKCNRQNIGTNIGPMPRPITASDRVLRSFNLKSLRKTYGAVNLSNPNVRNQATSPKERIQIVAGRMAEVNVTKCLERRHRPSILGGNSFGVRNQKRYIIAHNEDVTAPMPKRQRALSGIYPLIPPELEYNVNTIQGVRLRHTDGRLSTINALVQKRSLPERFKPPKHNEITIQDIFGSIDINLNDTDTPNYLQPYPNIGHIDMTAPISEYRDDQDRCSVYYHKKIRSEQVRYQRMNCREGKEELLPKINDAFSRFSGVLNRDVSQPLFIQVGEPDVLPPYSGRNIANSHMLESLYNFKTNLLTNAPLLQIATTANTKCVYSTPVIATAMAQQPATLVPTEPFNMPPCEPDNQYRCSHDIEMPHLYELIKQPDHDFSLRSLGYREVSDVSTSTSSLDTSQSQPGGSVTIPEMVEDALEIISQDGDYMEQIGMDLRVQCVLCSWAGPKIILEFHIRKEHPTQILKLNNGESNVVHTLGSLAHGRLWLGSVLEHDTALYVLSVKCEEDCLMATLTALSSDVIEKHGKIIIYNKVTGEPYSWAGDIPPLPPNLPYENDVTCLKIDLTKLDLLPNSANLKLVNNELVLKSPTKVVVGQPELNDIHIILFVRIS